MNQVGLLFQDSQNGYSIMKKNGHSFQNALHLTKLTAPPNSLDGQRNQITKYLSNSEIEIGKEIFSKLLSNSIMSDKGSYRPEEVKAILGVSSQTLHTYCNLWEPYEVTGRCVKGLESYKIGGARRIPKHALIEWLAINNRSK